MSVTKKCVVPGCKSNREDLKHSFPRRLWSAEKWREAVNSPIIADVKIEELYKYVVCYKHFTEGDYHWSQKRRRLNTNSVPHLNLDNPVVDEETAPENSNTSLEQMTNGESGLSTVEDSSNVRKKRRYTRRNSPYVLQPVTMKEYFILVPKSYWQSNKDKNEMILKLEPAENS